MVAQLSFQLQSVSRAFKTPVLWRIQRGITVLARWTHCERRTPDGWRHDRSHGLQAHVGADIEQVQAGNAIPYGDERPGAKCGCGDRMVLRHCGDEVGVRAPKLKIWQSLWRRIDTDGTSTQDRLAKVFLEAKTIFEENIKQAGKPGQTPFEGKTSMLDVQLELLHALKRYESASESKARRWLVALSERIAFYGQIFDVLNQHHPEYVSLAWGTFKFIFQVFLSEIQGHVSN